ncbi:MAG: mono/diheme cytochrome c family protein [Mariniblastus sp.]
MFFGFARIRVRRNSAGQADWLESYIKDGRKMAEENTTDTTQENSKLVGLLAQFDDPDSLVQACDQARQAGYTKTDAYSPFPVHGIDPAIGIKRTILPMIVLSVALGAVVLGLGMQWYTNGGMQNVSTAESPIFPGYQFKISGKPIFSLPANIPVTFEVIVLSSAFATFFGMWFLNKLPMLSNPLHRISRFKRATNDKFFLMIEQGDKHFNRSSTELQLNEWGAVAIEECRQDLTDNKLPSWLRLVALLGAVMLIIPPVVIFRTMGMTNRAPRLHFMPDMDWQEKSKTQTLSPILAKKSLFADDRAMRQPVEGSVARGQLQADTEMYQGIKQDFTPTISVTATVASARTSVGNAQDEAAAPAPAAEDVSKYITEFPAGIEVNAELLARGQERFNIYCTACHGYSGNGDGLVNQRALALAATSKATWTKAKSMHDPLVEDDAKNPVGRIFDTITNGRATMGPYGDQIPAADRWAIVAYVKALQETGIEPPVVVSEEEPADAETATETEKTDDGTDPQP